MEVHGICRLRPSQRLGEKMGSRAVAGEIELIVGEDRMEL